MFSSTNIFVQVLAVFLSVGLITVTLWLMSRFANQFGLTKNIFVGLAFFSFVVMLCVFVIDVILAYHINLLTENERSGIFELFKNLFLVVLGYFFRDATKDKKDEPRQ